MATLSIEYSGGFCEPVKDAVDAAQKVRRSACHSDPVRIFPGGCIQSQTNKKHFSMNFYEKNFRGEKLFVARVYAAGPFSDRDLERVVQLV